MLQLPLAGVERILCVGCHPDDIEIGCGGALLRLIQQSQNLEVCWVVLSGEDARAEEARRSADRWLNGVKKRRFVQTEFWDSYFPGQYCELKEYIHSIAKQFEPDLIFTHRRDDAHQDHRLVGEITWNAFRNHLILEYEIPKYDGDLGRPNVLAPLEQEICQRKVESIVELFATQRTKPWFTSDVFWSLLRLRGIECGGGARFAEGFYASKIALDV